MISLHPKAAGKGGFTLIEMLVVVAIISLLAAILFPVFSAVREKARAASCASNLKQIGLGLMQYQQDYDEQMPIGAYYTPANTTSLGAGWYGSIYPYVKSTDVARCPSDMTKASKGGFLIVSYAANMNLAGPYKYSRLSSWQKPSVTVMACEFGRAVAKLDLGDEGYWAVKNAGSAYQYPLSPTTDGYFAQGGCNQPFGVANVCTDTSAGADFGLYYQADGNFGGNNANQGYTAPAFGYLGGIVPSNSTRYFPTLGRHSEGSNFLFSDGHVKWLKPSQVSPGPTATGGKYQGQTAGGTSSAATDKMFLSDGVTAVAATFSPQ